MKHHEPLVKHHEPLIKDHETLLKHCETWTTSKTSWNTHGSMRQHWRSMQRYLCSDSQPANTTIATSVNKHLCQHTVDESTIQSTRAGFGRCYLAFAVANCVLNREVCYSDCWKLRRLLEAATGCRRGPQFDRKCFFYFNYYFFHTTPTNRDLRQQAV